MFKKNKICETSAVVAHPSGPGSDSVDRDLAWRLARYGPGALTDQELVSAAAAGTTDQVRRRTFSDKKNLC